MEENSLAVAAKIVATLSNLSEEQCFSPEDEKHIESIIKIVSSGMNNPQEMKRILNLISTKELSDSVHNCLHKLMPAIDKLCHAEEAAKSSPEDAQLRFDVKKTTACVTALLTKLQSENKQALTKDRIQWNHWTQTQDTVGPMARAILQISGAL
ncbi:MAG: hypothetical protein C5B45_06165 [Chlamydiae bacterium]|nr:MAG: hypothetical protein C5B45_06165 [Chlamydiota bacterium]